MQLSGFLRRALRATYEDLHALIEAVVHDKRVAHPDTCWFHAICSCKGSAASKRVIISRVSWSIVEATNVRVEEIALPNASGDD